MAKGAAKPKKAPHSSGEVEVFVRFALWVKDRTGRIYPAGPRLLKGYIGGVRPPPRLEFTVDEASEADREAKELETYLNAWDAQCAKNHKTEEKTPS